MFRKHFSQALCVYFDSKTFVETINSYTYCRTPNEKQQPSQQNWYYCSTLFPFWSTCSFKQSRKRDAKLLFCCSFLNVYGKVITRLSSNWTTWILVCVTQQNYCYKRLFTTSFTAAPVTFKLTHLLYIFTPLSHPWLRL